MRIKWENDVKSLAWCLAHKSKGSKIFSYYFTIPRGTNSSKTPKYGIFGYTYFSLPICEMGIMTNKRKELL